VKECRYEDVFFIASATAKIENRATILRMGCTVGIHEVDNIVQSLPDVVQLI
jgi:hypothetical protein